MKKIYTLIAALLFCAALFIAYLSTPHHISWAMHISEETLQDGWMTWNTHYRCDVNAAIDRKTFFDLVQHGYYEEISVDQFLSLNVENQRLLTYKHATSPEEMYPPQDRPRGQKDIDAVYYLMKTKHKISPVFVAKIVQDKNAIRYIKLDGVHRLVAAKLTNSHVRIFFIEISQGGSC